ncbi:hypothetical protein ACQEU3_13570 [Spirillospora sp. CA-253888]
MAIARSSARRVVSISRCASASAGPTVKVTAARVLDLATLAREPEHFDAPERSAEAG